MATEIGSAPMLQSVQKAMALPTVEAAVGQVGAIYTKVKGAHSLLEWALSTAEASVTFAAATAAPYVAAPLAAGDAKMAAAIDELERRVPLVTEQPKVIVETTKQAVLAKITPQLNRALGMCARYQEPLLEQISTYHKLLPGKALSDGSDDVRVPYLPSKVFSARNVAEQRVKSLKELTWTKANALLSTAYGQKALHGVDTGATYAMQVLNHYLPPTQEETNAIGSEIVAAENDPALHTVQTVGRLSAVAARRVWANLSVRVNQLRDSGIELDVRRYITALLAALHLARVTSEQQSAAGPTAAGPTPPGPTAAGPTTNGHHTETPHSAPTTTELVKSTPEAKSNGSAI